MAVIAATPFLIQNTTLTLGADDFSSAISAAELVPTAPTGTFKSINGVPYNFTGKASWVLNVTFAQDWALATSLANYLYNNEGTTVAFEIKPTGTTAGFKGSVSLAAGAIGGAADAVAQASVTFQVVGKPARITV